MSIFVSEFFESEICCLPFLLSAEKKSLEMVRLGVADDDDGNNHGIASVMSSNELNRSSPIVRDAWFISGQQLG